MLLATGTPSGSERQSVAGMDWLLGSMVAVAARYLDERAARKPVV
jgi:hypothetical protein